MFVEQHCCWEGARLHPRGEHDEGEEEGRWEGEEGFVGGLY